MSPHWHTEYWRRGRAQAGSGAGAKVMVNGEPALEARARADWIGLGWVGVGGARAGRGGITKGGGKPAFFFRPAEKGGLQC